MRRGFQLSPELGVKQRWGGVVEMKTVIAGSAPPFAVDVPVITPHTFTFEDPELELRYLSKQRYRAVIVNLQLTILAHLRTLKMGAQDQSRSEQRG